MTANCKWAVAYASGSGGRNMTTPSGGTTWSRQAHVNMAEAIDKHLRDNKIAEKAN